MSSHGQADESGVYAAVPPIAAIRSALMTYERVDGGD